MAILPLAPNNDQRNPKFVKCELRERQSQTEAFSKKSPRALHNAERERFQRAERFVSAALHFRNICLSVILHRSFGFIVVKIWEKCDLYVATQICEHLLRCTFNFLSVSKGTLTK